MHLLFIGGPLDGQVHDVDDQPCVDAELPIADPSPGKILRDLIIIDRTIVRYTREIVAIPPKWNRKLVMIPTSDPWRSEALEKIKTWRTK
jgi:hypothetical protein